MSFLKNYEYNKLIIIGSGPAGYTASIYAARANLNPTLITGDIIGGQLIGTNSIENWPGVYDPLNGMELMDRFYKHSIKFGTNIIRDKIKRVDFKKKPFILFGNDNNYTADALIIATGASPRYLGLESENVFKGKGVSTCAVCDGFFYKNKTVAVVGGGNSAIEESLYLSNISSKIYLIHRRNTFKAEKILLSRLLKQVQANKIILMTNFKVLEIMGNNSGVNSILLQSTINENHTQKINIFGVFIAIGHIPNTSIFSKQLNMENGYIKVLSRNYGNSTQTSIRGIFAAGDVIDHTYKQAITASASGCMAALDAEKYLDSLNI